MQPIRKCNDCKECDHKSPLFMCLSPQDLEIINKDRFVVSYQPGELIHKVGSSFTHIISINSGLVKCYLEGERKDLIIRIAKHVDMLLGPGLYIDSKHHNSSMALTKVEACYIPFENFKEVIKRNPAFSEEVIREISAQGLFSFSRLMSLTQKQVPGRIAEALLYFQDVYQQPSFELNLSRQELADFCGATKESVIRVMKDFKEEQLITVENNHFSILNNQHLKKISEVG